MLFNGNPYMKLLLKKLLNFVYRLMLICRCIYLQMNALVQPLVDYIALRKNRSKYFWIGVIIFLVIFLYIFIYWFNSPIIDPGSVFKSQYNELDPFEEISSNCLNSKFLNLDVSKNKFNVFINHHPLEYEELPFYPYIGNGHFGASFDDSNSKIYLYFKNSKFPIPFNPIISLSLQSFQHKSATILNIYDGLLIQYSTFSIGYACVTAEISTYIHRKRNLLVQEIRVTNMEDSSFEFELKSNSLSPYFFNISQLKFKYRNAEFISGTHCSNNLCIALTTTILTNKIIVKSSSSVSINRFTNIKLSNESSLKVLYSLMKENIKDLENNMKIDDLSLRKEHIVAWNSLWSSGFGISYSKAAGSLNGDQINSTIYYLLSHVTLASTNKSEVGQLIRPIDFPDRCYSGHSTLQNTNMWKRPRDDKDISLLVKTWFKTLDKQGCSNLVLAGADGVLQAVVLSIGGLKFSRDHLEFSMHPQDLHRDFFFRRINYGAGTHLNISVVVSDDNRARLYVSLDRYNMPYYACDAGCLDDPVPLGNSSVILPVKLTNPVTPILYITSDFQHMKDLRHVIHVQHIVEAPAHGHEVMVLHKHGHHWSGLPILFWASFISLIAIFHLFLLRLIYNELCGGGGVPTSAYYRENRGPRFGPTRMPRYV